jgi:uncharacterized protein (DUF427 family)
MVTAAWKGRVVAESATTVFLEGNHYFPADTVALAHLRPSATRTICPWKGTAHYYDVVVDGEENHDAAWYYPNPQEAASAIKDRVAFWRGVRVTASD